MANEALFKEIEKEIRSTYFDKMLAVQNDCTLEFRTRGGHLSIAFDNETDVLVGGVARKQAAGLSPDQLELFLEHLEKGITRQKAINVCDIRIHSQAKKGNLSFCKITYAHHERV
ncbi:hypothetical protein J2T17_007119 [Paenibacillus mucilaginosus]|uniref:hypothetical protein n=1 Tax=Paenibacillus mucilaginosus TaxID=61624 RepID=UPI003D22D871